MKHKYYFVILKIVIWLCDSVDTAQTTG
jgi:hypothetical protein